MQLVTSSVTFLKGGIVKKSVLPKSLCALLLATCLLSSSKNHAVEPTGIIILGIALSSTAFVTTSVMTMDIAEATSLLDEAYAGGGPKLESLARVDKKGRSVEEIAEIIVEMEHAGKISSDLPNQMVRAIYRKLKM